MPSIPVIDVFAGPGGLGEGFAQYRISGDPVFRIKLSIEKDPVAYRTLKLRSLFRNFPADEVPEAYYDFLRNTRIPEAKRYQHLFESFPEVAQEAEYTTWRAKLGKEHHGVVFERIRERLAGHLNWVLLGGPPCQVYSMAGRSRNVGNMDYDPESDERQYLYVDYLQILGDHRPAIFIMENVKGLLSATLRNQKVFERICEDLQSPVDALRREGRVLNGNFNRKSFIKPKYRLFSLVNPKAAEKPGLTEFIVRMECFGVPQARHRLIVLGVREDLSDIIPRALAPQPQVTAREVLADLPPLRSGLTREEDTLSNWRRRILQIADRKWFRKLENDGNSDVVSVMHTALGDIRTLKLERGAEFIPCSTDLIYRRDRYSDPRIGGICNHSSRAHMFSDLYRYFYAASYGVCRSYSPRLKDFPKALLPNHANAEYALGGNLFPDRFRVQIEGRPATTVTSHISRDGHYYIHPDPTQCRSLTVREAARLQTFPDNYYFCGSRTSQYTQVGNAVPPLLAHQIAGIVSDILVRSGVIG